MTPHLVYRASPVFFFSKTRLKVSDCKSKPISENVIKITAAPDINTNINIITGVHACIVTRHVFEDYFAIKHELRSY